MLTCPKINEFSHNIFGKFNNMPSSKTLSNKMRLFGSLDSNIIKNEDTETWDLLTLLMNRYIYYSNFHESKLSIEGFTNEIKVMTRIEYAIAERKGKLGFHLAKWERIGETLGYNVLTS
jgi:hypothetical protein